MGFSSITKPATRGEMLLRKFHHDLAVEIVVPFQMEMRSPSLAQSQLPSVNQSLRSARLYGGRELTL